MRTGKHTVLVDACSGNHKPRPGMPRFDMLNSKYLDRLREAGVQPEEIDFVMCTHLHVDHVGWNTQRENGKWVPTFPNAKYVMSRTDHDHWAALAKKPDTEASRSTPTTIRCCRSSRRRRPSSCRASTPCAAA